MHELSLCEGILRILEDSSKAQGFNKVKTVWLEVGDLAGVELSALRFNFEVVSRGTLAELAAVEVVRVPGQAWCMQCSELVSVQELYDACPKCKSYQLQITQGKDMKVKELEVE